MIQARIAITNMVCKVEGAVSELETLALSQLKEIIELEAQLERKTLALKTCLGNCNTHELNEAEAIEKNLELEAQLDEICDGFVDGNCTETYIHIAPLIKSLTNGRE